MRLSTTAAAAAYVPAGQHVPEECDDNQGKDQQRGQHLEEVQPWSTRQQQLLARNRARAQEHMDEPSQSKPCPYGLGKNQGPPGARMREDDGDAGHGAHGKVQSPRRRAHQHSQLDSEREGRDHQQNPDVQQVGGPAMVAAAVPRVHSRQPSVHEQAGRHRGAKECKAARQDERLERRPLCSRCRHPIARAIGDAGPG